MFVSIYRERVYASESNRVPTSLKKQHMYGRKRDENEDFMDKAVSLI